MPLLAVIGLDHPPHSMAKRDAVTEHGAYVTSNDEAIMQVASCPTTRAHSAARSICSRRERGSDWFLARVGAVRAPGRLPRSYRPSLETGSEPAFPAGMARAKREIDRPHQRRRS